MKPENRFRDAIMGPFVAVLAFAAAFVIYLIGQSDFRHAEKCVKGTQDYLYYTTEGWAAVVVCVVLLAMVIYLLFREIFGW